MGRARIALTALAGSGLLASGATAASPVEGSVAGPVVKVAGDTFTLATPASLNVPKNRSTVDVVSSTVITEQQTLSRSDVKTGLCASAFGTRNSKGVVASQRITLTAPVKGSCTAGSRFGGGGTGRFPPGGGSFGSSNFGFAFGKITKVKGTTFTVKGARGTTTVTDSAKTQVSRTVKVGKSAIRLKECAFVRGTSTNKGATVKAQSIALSQPVSGGCTNGFRRP
jgi:hypothetical protein